MSDTPKTRQAILLPDDFKNTPLAIYLEGIGAEVFTLTEEQDSIRIEGPLGLRVIEGVRGRLVTEWYVVKENA